MELSKDQRLILKGFHGHGDGKEKALFINKIFSWKLFYAKYFGKDLNILSEVSIPPKPPEGNWRLLIVCQVISIWDLIRLCWGIDGRKITPTEAEEVKLSVSLIESIRSANFNPYAKWIPDRRYVTRQVMEDFGLTVEEFLLDELKLFEETSHIGSYESCQMLVLYGSKYLDESNPIVYRDYDKTHLHIHSDNFFTAQKCRLG